MKSMKQSIAQDKTPFYLERRDGKVCICRFRTRAIPLSELHSGENLLSDELVYVDPDAVPWTVWLSVPPDCPFLDADLYNSLVDGEANRSKHMLLAAKARLSEYCEDRVELYHWPVLAAIQKTEGIFELVARLPNDGCLTIKLSDVIASLRTGVQVIRVEIVSGRYVLFNSTRNGMICITAGPSVILTSDVLGCSRKTPGWDRLCLRADSLEPDQDLVLVIDDPQHTVSECRALRDVPEGIVERQLLNKKLR